MGESESDAVARRPQAQAKAIDTKNQLKTGRWNVRVKRMRHKKGASSRVLILPFLRPTMFEF